MKAAGKHILKIKPGTKFRSTPQDTSLDGEWESGFGCF